MVNLLISYDYQGLEEYHYDYDLEGKIIRSYICDYQSKKKKFTYEYGYDESERLKYEINIMDGKVNKKEYYYDHESGLYYLQSRYYDYNTLRFINADDVLIILSN